MALIKPAGYRNLLENTENTEKAIKLVKDMFQENLSAQLVLLRVTAPMVVLSGTGINDDLNSVERPVSFPIRDMNEQRAEVVHSLAKWKRLKLAEMKMPEGRGIYTDMNALRPDEELDNLHSLYVDQWDWEKVISREQRNTQRSTVKKNGSPHLRSDQSDGKQTVRRFSSTGTVFTRGDPFYPCTRAAGPLSGQNAQGAGE